jgi:peptidoglycan/LPS O-acetylase OafA/YrhL
MALRETSVIDERRLPSGDEAGTAPDDRRFRPDVEGLRAVAVLLVVLYHAGVPRISGGYVGVDVFFVISGFVITGLLLRERHGTSRTSILDFYARRCRRILPAATLVILVAVLFTYVLVGFIAGNNVADDGRWAAAFLSNFHFEAVGTNYFTAHLPPSPLQNYWSLSVEEQFYIVYPTLFLLVAGLKGRLSLRVKMAIALGLIIVASYWLSVVQTASSPATAYFSPLTRAWELALGALVAVGTSWLKQIPGQLAAVLTWAGLGAILFAAFAFNAQTAYPGSLVAVPVVGAALIIAGGTAIPRSGAESVLGLQPCRWLGKRSYSLYLWHWPILIIAAERVGKTSLPVGENLLLVLVALVASMGSYKWVENPIRHLRLPSKQSIGAGIGLIITTIVVLSLVITTQTVSTPHYPVIPAANNEVVSDQVAAAPRITRVPKSIEPSLSQAADDWGGSFEGLNCIAGVRARTQHICTLGDIRGSHLMVALGDSHVLMWLPALNAIAKASHYQLVVLSHWYCPVSVVTVANPPGLFRVGGPFTACDQWRKWAIKWITKKKPSFLLISQEDLYTTPSTRGSAPSLISASRWQKGLLDLLDQVNVPNGREVVLGNIPVLPKVPPPCLASHRDDVQACSAKRSSATTSLATAERSAAASAGAEYIDPTDWFCSTTCTAIVGQYVVYMDQFHVTATYARYLQNVLSEALNL